MFSVACRGVFLWSVIVYSMVCKMYIQWPKIIMISTACKDVFVLACLCAFSPNPKHTFFHALLIVVCEEILMCFLWPRNSG